MVIFRSFIMFTLALLALSFACAPSAAAKVKIKDIVDIEGVRGNDLVGYGLVIGLDGSGDSIRNSPYTEEALSNLLERLGVNIQGSNFKPNNVAAVIVTASLPPFARSGSRIDINVSSIGDASSLAGGTLIMMNLILAPCRAYVWLCGPPISRQRSVLRAKLIAALVKKSRHCSTRARWNLTSNL